LVAVSAVVVTPIVVSGSEPLVGRVERGGAAEVVVGVVVVMVGVVEVCVVVGATGVVGVVVVVCVVVVVAVFGGLEDAPALFFRPECLGLRAFDL
jgi:hypothetical protein